MNLPLSSAEQLAWARHLVIAQRAAQVTVATYLSLAKLVGKELAVVPLADIAAGAKLSPDSASSALARLVAIGAVKRKEAPGRYWSYALNPWPKEGKQ